MKLLIISVAIASAAFAYHGLRADEPPKSGEATRAAIETREAAESARGQPSGLAPSDPLFRAL